MYSSMTVTREVMDTPHLMVDDTTRGGCCISWILPLPISRSDHFDINFSNVRWVVVWSRVWCIIQTPHQCQYARTAVVDVFIFTWGGVAAWSGVCCIKLTPLPMAQYSCWWPLEMKMLQVINYNGDSDDDRGEKAEGFWSESARCLHDIEPFAFPCLLHMHWLIASIRALSSLLIRCQILSVSIQSSSLNTKFGDQPCLICFSISK